MSPVNQSLFGGESSQESVFDKAYETKQFCFQDILDMPF